MPVAVGKLFRCQAEQSVEPRPSHRLTPLKKVQKDVEVLGGEERVRVNLNENVDGGGVLKAEAEGMLAAEAVGDELFD